MTPVSRGATFERGALVARRAIPRLRWGLLALLLASCQEAAESPPEAEVADEVPSDAEADSTPGDSESPSDASDDADHPDAVAPGPAIVGVVVSDELALPYFGDLWANTWADDDGLYMAWGDGTGMADCAPTFTGTSPSAWGDGWTYVETSPGCFEIGRPPADGVMQALFCDVFDCNAGCYPLCPFTPFGLLRLTGDLPAPEPCAGGACVIARDIPSGDAGSARGSNDKPSSLLFADGRLYLAAHRPAVAPVYGYIAVSDDRGRTFSEVPGSPWGEGSLFRVLMLINMGRAYELNEDGFVYGLGLPQEIADPLVPMLVHLLRVPRDDLADYDRYEYFSGSAQRPEWSSDPAAARALPGIETIAQGSVIYHPGIDRYLFLSGLNELETLTGALYEAPAPWGPWTRAAAVPGGFIPSLIAKGSGPDFVYFTKAGGTSGYNLNIGRIQLELASSPDD
jgi:hypothetical protein